MAGWWMGVAGWLYGWMAVYLSPCLPVCAVRLGLDGWRAAMTVCLLWRVCFSASCASANAGRAGQTGGVARDAKTWQTVP